MIDVTTVISLQPRQITETRLTLDDGATVADALARAGLALESGMSTGVWNRKAELSQVLRQGDRVEVYRPLLVDPKVARRLRFERQGKRAAGLFSRRAR
ncbi:MAG: hypothetical protein RLZZ401_1611 [Pseudomonadota bacterium]|jgi:sulfur carrier protein